MKIQIWFILIAIVVILVALALFLFTDFQDLVPILLGAFGTLLLIGAVIWYTVKGRGADKDGYEPPKETGEFIRRKIQVIVPKIGAAAEKATVKGTQGIMNKTLELTKLLNDTLTKSIVVTGDVYMKVKRAVYVVVLGVLLSEVGIGEVMIGSEIAGLVGSVAGPTAGSAVGSAATSVLGSIGGSIGGSTLTSLASTGGSALSSIGLSTAGAAVSDVAGSVGGQIGLGLTEQLGKEAVKYGSGKLSSYLDSSKAG